MEMKILSLGKLKLQELEIGHLYLDPNNPRFMGEESLNITPFDKYTNQKVQERALENMKNYGIKELRSNIEEVGFLPIDKMVFREIPEFINEYYCLEGNRRLAAIKSIIDDHNAGEITLKDEVWQTINKIEVYVLDDVEDPKRAQEIIQGIRHMSGVRDWRPYQKASIIYKLIIEGKTPTEIGKIFGNGSQTVMKYYRTFRACQQFINDDEYGDNWHSELFRMFEDVIKRPRLRDNWLKWNEDTGEFTNITELEYFYKWIIPDPDTKERKIPGANYIKDLDTIVSHSAALEYLKNEGTTLASALSLTREPLKEITWTNTIQEAIRMLSTIDVSTLENLKENEQKLLVDLSKEINLTLERAKKLSTSR